MTRTVSARISNELHEQLRDRCNEVGSSINDFLVGCIELGMFGYTTADIGEEEEQNSKEVGQPATVAPTKERNTECCSVDGKKPNASKVRHIVVE
jgi:hypothetical protein